MSSPVKTCSVEGCGRTDIQGGGHCRMHYHRKRRTGSAGQPERLYRESRSETCSVEGCGKADKQRGLCSMHAARVRRHGSASVVIEPAERKKNVGDDHHNFLGDDAGYQTMHGRIRLRRGPASAHKCMACGGRALHWAYGHNDPNVKYDERGYPYSTDVMEYIPLCVTCHKEFDNNQKL